MMYLNIENTWFKTKEDRLEPKHMMYLNETIKDTPTFRESP